MFRASAAISSPSGGRLSSIGACRMASSDESIVVDEAPEPPPTRPHRRQRQRPLEGPLRVYLVVVCADGLFQGFRGDVPEGWAQAEGASLIVGALLAAAWALVGVEHEPGQVGREYQRRQALRTSRAACQGFVEYPIKAAAMLTRPVEVAEGTMRALLGLIESVSARFSSSDSSTEGLAGRTMGHVWTSGWQLGPRLAQSFAWRRPPP